MIVAHLDLDAFFAAVEELEDPSLRRQPLVVGGNPQGRGVVATANYAARRFGIHSAMSCAEAKRRCPHAVFLTPRHALYRDYSRAVWDSVRHVVPTVERTGIDEGYLDMTDIAADFLQARRVAEAVQAAVRGATSLSCSLGVAPCKVVAKVASDLRKPGGLLVVPAGREAAFLAPFDLRKLPGVGPRSEQRLRAAGLETIGQLAALDDADLRRLLPGKVGRLLRDRARGIDPRGLELAVERISVSHEETFERDVADREVLHAELRRMAERLAEHLSSRGEAARTITTKVRYPDFAIRSRSTTLAAGVDDAETIGDVACRLLDRALRDRCRAAAPRRRRALEHRAVPPARADDSLAGERDFAQPDGLVGIKALGAGESAGEELAGQHRQQRCEHRQGRLGHRQRVRGVLDLGRCVSTGHDRRACRSHSGTRFEHGGEGVIARRDRPHGKERIERGDRAMDQVGRRERLGGDPTRLLQLERDLARGGELEASTHDEHAADEGERVRRGRDGSGQPRNDAGHLVGDPLEPRRDAVPPTRGAAGEQRQPGQLVDVGLRRRHCVLRACLQRQDEVGGLAELGRRRVRERDRQRATLPGLDDVLDDVGRLPRLRERDDADRSKSTCAP